MVSNFFAFAPTFHGGVFVASGNYTENVDGNINDSATHFYDDIVTGAGAGGQSHVKVWRLDNGQGTAGRICSSSFPAATYSAYGVGVNSAVHVGTVADLNGDGLDDFITGPGAGGGPHAIVWGSKAFIDSNGDPLDLSTYNPPILQQQMAYSPSYTGGISVG